jgi:hypothetical protein
VTRLAAGTTPVGVHYGRHADDQWSVHELLEFTAT